MSNHFGHYNENTIQSALSRPNSYDHQTTLQQINSQARKRFFQNVNRIFAR